MLCPTSLEPDANISTGLRRSGNEDADRMVEMLHVCPRRRECHGNLCRCCYSNSDYGAHPIRTASLAPPSEVNKHLEYHQTLVVPQSYTNTANIHKYEHLNNV